mmetsp:Transcript_30541/g.98747  ORF Transcript_30541/g.98747 Transcript_30541/m.98747 type:complete len:321 (+) Transcript_30541:870-1832(+)
MHGLPLHFRRARSDGAALPHAISGHPCASRQFHLGLKRLGHRRCNVYPLHRAAHLPAVLQRELNGVRRGLIQVGIVQYDHRVLAAALEHDRLERAGGRLQDLGACGGRAGEGAHVHVRVRHQVAAHLAVALQQLQQPRVGGAESFHQALCDGARRERDHLRWLDHDGVARDERRDRQQHDLLHWVVPRRADGHHPVGVAHDHGAAVRLGRVGGGDQVAVVVHVRVAIHLGLGLAERLSHLLGDQGRERRLDGTEAAHGRLDRSGPLSKGERRPARLRPPRGGHSGVDVGMRRNLDALDHLARCRVDVDDEPVLDLDALHH